MLKYTNSSQFISDYKKYLEDNGITSAHIARKMQISPQQLNNIYNKKELTFFDIQRLCTAINYECKVEIRPMKMDD